MARLNGYLYLINFAETDQCACEQARETVEYFLFRRRKWTAHRTEMQGPSTSEVAAIANVGPILQDEIHGLWVSQVNSEKKRILASVQTINLDVVIFNEQRCNIQSLGLHGTKKQWDFITHDASEEHIGEKRIKTLAD
ncbi:hypothetical protein N7513_003649 [Penicillium frequentans]|nr:hypothetical protein N7513_003649 [Penicillium glabrum]